MEQEWSGVRGKRVVITGGTGGIGLAAAEALAARGALLTIVGRSAARASAAAARIAAAAPGAEVVQLVADLSSQADVRRLAGDILARHERIHVLANNAGAFFVDRQLTADGLERTWALNHLSPFLLTTLLLDRLKASAPARVITTSSAAHRGAHIPWDDPGAERGYRGFARYGQSKLANILFTAELARRLGGTGVTANCFHPGLVATGFGMNNRGLAAAALALVRPFARTPARGAETLVWLADAPEAGAHTGLYFVDRRPARPDAAALDPGAAARLWSESEAAVAAARRAG